MKDHYNTLRVPEDATQAQIRKVYRELARIYHPDTTVLDTKHATEELKELNEAYEVLSDSTKRAAYDRQRAKGGRYTDQSKPPRPSVSPVRLDFGTLWKGEQRSELVTVNNLGGAVQEINLTHSEEEAWFAIAGVESFSEMEPCPLKVEITVETDALSAGRYDGWLDVGFDGVTVRVNLGVQVRIKPKPKPRPKPRSRPKPKPKWTPPPPPPPISPRGSARREIRLLPIALVTLVVVGGIVGMLAIPLAMPSPEVIPEPTLSSASPTAVLQLGQMAFVLYENGQPIVHLAQTNQTNRLIEGQSPALSPSGSQVVYISNQSGSEQLYLVNTTGGSPTRLTDTPQEKFSPAWLGQGQIAFIADDGILYSLKADGTELKELTNVEIGQVTHFTWSPDGGQLLFDAQQHGERRVYRINADGSGLFQLTDPSDVRTSFDSWAPAWSPAGQIAVSSERGIHTLDDQGKNQLRLTTFRAWSPAWSSDGKQIAFLSDRGNAQLNPELWLMDADGRNQARLTTSGCWAYAWAPKGNWLAYITGNMQTQPPALTLWALNVETKEKRYIADVNEPIVSWTR